QIASAAEEQSLVTADINGNTESVREVSDQMTHEAQLAAEEAQEVHRLMTELGREISRFKL
ncbi:methyl-accepting chemotaxis protein, partial [Vibrio gazogenes DSM 21264]